MGERRNGSRSSLRIPVAGLEDREYPFEFEVTPEDLELEEKVGGVVKVTGVLSKVGTQFAIRGRIEAREIGECDRCLNPTDREVDLPFERFYRMATPEEEPRVDDVDQREGIELISSDEFAIALDEEVRQTILLNYPMKNLCSEECLGLCTGCGANLNAEECRCEETEVDPRWAKLKDLLGKDPETN